MKAAFALLTNTHVTNFVSKIAWRIHLSHHTGVGVRRLPPHVSLKQPFDIDDLDDLERFMDGFAQSIEPFLVEMEGYQLWEVPTDQPKSGVLSIRIKKTAALRAIQNRLNHELTEHFGEKESEFDGDAYSFHITIAMGNGPLEEYRLALADCEDSFPMPVQSFTAQELALFVYDNDEGKDDWQYATYKVVSLGTDPSS